MTDLTPFFAGIMAALGRPIAKAQHHTPKGSTGPDGKPNGGQFAAGWNLDPAQVVPAVHLRGDEVGQNPTWREATIWAKANLRGTYQNQATGWDVTVSTNGIAEGIHRLAAAGIPGAIAAIPGIIANAVPVHSGPDLKGRADIHAMHTFLAPLTIGDRQFRAVLTVCDTIHGHGYHGHQVEELDIEIPGDLGEVHRQNLLGCSHPPGNTSLGQLLHNFKTHTGEKP